jgi:hypothetical protein
MLHRGQRISARQRAARRRLLFQGEQRLALDQREERGKERRGLLVDEDGLRKVALRDALPEPEDRETARPAALRGQRLDLPGTGEIGLGRGQRLLFGVDQLQIGRESWTNPKGSPTLPLGSTSFAVTRASNRWPARRRCAQQRASKLSRADGRKISSTTDSRRLFSLGGRLRGASGMSDWHSGPLPTLERRPLRCSRKRDWIAQQIGLNSLRDRRSAGRRAGIRAPQRPSPAPIRSHGGRDFGRGQDSGVTATVTSVTSRILESRPP